MNSQNLWMNIPNVKINAPALVEYLNELQKFPPEEASALQGRIYGWAITSVAQRHRAVNHSPTETRFHFISSIIV